MEWKQEIARIEQFIKDNAPNGVVIGISGGVDSAVVHELCIRALGKDKVRPLCLPYGNQSNEDAFNLCKARTTWNLINITGVVDSTVSNIFTLNIDKKVRGNIISRVRMTHLYYFASVNNCRVVGTTNKSEWLTGYFTKFGDGACDFEPILHLYKTEIFELAKELGIPQVIIDKAPSADLWEGQTDEGELGLTYDALDKILRGEMSKASDILRVQQLHQSSEHKRNSPPSLLEAE